jgi:predicted nucleic acid-binding protein
VSQAIPLPQGLEADLDPGEQEAIALAQENCPDVLLLIDENKGREEAQRRNIQTMEHWVSLTLRPRWVCWTFRVPSKRY